MVVNAVIDTHVRVPLSAPPALLASLRAALETTNQEKANAIRQMVRGAKSMPDVVRLWSETDQTLVLPRGAVFEFERIASKLGVEVSWRARMALPAHVSPFAFTPPVDLRDYQQTAVGELLGWAGGFYVAPTGAGKTQVMLEVIRRCAQPAVVVVEKVDLAQQWEDRARGLGFDDVGVVGDGRWEDDCSLVVAIRQSLWARLEDLLERRWFEHWGTLVLDEAHHGASDTNQQIISLFPAFYRFGCSATPARDEESWPFIRALIGPIVHDTDRESVGESLITPSVEVLRSEFEYDYVPAHMELNPETNRQHRVGNNYSTMMTELQADDARNCKIIRRVLREAIGGHACLVLSRRKEQLREMCSLLETLMQEHETPVPYFMLTAENSSGARALLAAIDGLEGGSILFSTVADEGTDCPRLDRLFLAFPSRKIPKTRQAIGRIMRPHERKTDAVVFDVFDERVPVLRGQFRQRRQELWSKEGFEVVMESER